MHKRSEFEIEFDNEAESLVKDLVFLDEDSPLDIGSQHILTLELKYSALYSYCNTLDRRAERKAFIFDHGLTDYKSVSLVFVRCRSLPSKKTAQKRRRSWCMD